MLNKATGINNKPQPGLSGFIFPALKNTIKRLIVKRYLELHSL
jgi:hypothetical protein